MNAAICCVMDKRIELMKNEKGWNAAEYIDGKPSPELLRFFGTHILPLPYTAAASADMVLANTTQLNPSAVVMLAG